MGSFNKTFVSSKFVLLVLAGREFIPQTSELKIDMGTIILSNKSTVCETVPPPLLSLPVFKQLPPKGPQVSPTVTLPVAVQLLGFPVFFSVSNPGFPKCSLCVIIC